MEARTSKPSDLSSSARSRKPCGRLAQHRRVHAAIAGLGRAVVGKGVVEKAVAVARVVARAVEAKGVAVERVVAVARAVVAMGPVVVVVFYKRGAAGALHYRFRCG